METDSLTLDEVRRMAQAVGLDHLTDEHMRELARAANVAHARRKALRLAGLTPADEPAHVFRLDTGELP